MYEQLGIKIVWKDNFQRNTYWGDNNIVPSDGLDVLDEYELWAPIEDEV